MSSPGETGDLATTPLAPLLLELWRRRAVGELSVGHGGGVSRVFFRGGANVGAQAYVGFQPIGQLLVERGLIGMEQLERSLAEMARTSRRQGEILLSMGAVDEATLERVLAEQQAGYLSRIAAISDGTYRFDPAAAVPEWTVGVRVAPLWALRHALAAPQGAPLVAATLAAAPDRIVLAPAHAELAAAFGWSPEEQEVASRFAVASRVEEVVALGVVAPERARAVAAALLLVGAAEAAGDPVDLSEIAVAPAPSAATAPPAPTSPPAPASPPARRSDPAEARARRQRLLAVAMQNMGQRPAQGQGQGAGPGADPGRRPGGAPAADATSGRAVPPRADQETRLALQAHLPAATGPDLYARLELPHGASGDDVKKAYAQLVRRFHPDLVQAPAFADLVGQLRALLGGLNEALAVLTDEARRTEYEARAGSRARGGREGAGARSDAERGEAHLRSRDFTRARSFLEAAVAVERRPAWLASLARALVADPSGGDLARARALLEEAMKDTSCEAAFLAAAGLARSDDDEARAEKLYRAALRANPRSAEAASELRAIEGRRRSRAEARSDAKK